MAGLPTKGSEYGDADYWLDLSRFRTYAETSRKRAPAGHLPGRRFSVSGRELPCPTARRSVSALSGQPWEAVGTFLPMSGFIPNGGVFHAFNQMAAHMIG